MDNINEVIIFYFSGTGNSERIARWLAEFAEERDITSQVFNIAKTDISALNKFDKNTLIIIISPVHGFNFPKITLDFIRKFPKGKNNIVLMNTRAGLKAGNIVTPGLTGIAFMVSSFLLRRKGYKIAGQIPFDMPSNWISIHPALKKTSVDFIFEKNHHKLKKHAEKILSGEKDFLARRDIVQDILISPVSLAYYLAGRFFLSKSFYASNSCTQCGICEKSCPAKAIKCVDNRPYWTFKCESCMKCMNVCPVNAIETTHGLWVVVIVLSSFLTGFIYAFIASIVSSWFIKFIVFTALLILITTILYRFQHVLLRNKFMAKIITYMSLTYYKFWGRYKP